jgi:ABC-type Fe3+/spermidine/putrescine transport system ATPase subunit
MSAEMRVERLRKAFGTGRPAVDDVSFAVAAGEIVVLLGPSGCGKTTTLRCVAGLEQPTSGTIEIGGAVVSAPERGVLLPPRLRNIGMVFQSYAVWPHMTVWQNVAYPLRTRRLPRAEIGRKVDAVLALVGLSEDAQRPVVVLSGGQMQRVALARSLVYEPKLLLLDEPLSNLDAKLRLRLRDDVRRIIKQAGVTALYVTHDQAEAVVLGDRIGVMRDGKLLQLASADEIYNRPVDLFVAHFTGASNLLAGRVLERNGDFGLIETGPSHRLAAWLPPGVAAGSAVTIAVRPENVRCGADGAGDAGPNRFTARVVASRYEGVQTVYELDVLGGRLEAVEMGTSMRHPVNSTLEITLPVAQCWAYPAEDAADLG